MFKVLHFRFLLIMQQSDIKNTELYTEKRVTMKRVKEVNLYIHLRYSPSSCLWKTGNINVNLVSWIHS